MNYTIRLANCTFHARHGVLAEEATLGQRFHIDAELTVEDRGALVSDQVEGTVHYGEAFETIETIVRDTRRNLIETLAHDIAAALLDRFEPLQAAHITVRKPAVPIAGILDHAEVTVGLDRAS